MSSPAPNDPATIAAGDADPASSGSPRRRRGRPPPPPLKVRIELVVVGGEDGKELLRRQGIAVRQALQWFHDHPPPEPPLRED